MICEGWGFDGIGKDLEGNTILHFTEYEEEGVEESGEGWWMNYDDAIEKLREKIETLKSR